MMCFSATHPQQGTFNLKQCFKQGTLWMTSLNFCTSCVSGFNMLIFLLVKVDSTWNKMWICKSGLSAFTGGCFYLSYRGERGCWGCCSVPITVNCSKKITTNTGYVKSTMHFQWVPATVLVFTHLCQLNWKTITLHSCKKISICTRLFIQTFFLWPAADAFFIWRRRGSGQCCHGSNTKV